MDRLLVVEDELIERMVLKKMLQKKFEGQCEIFEAASGREAVEVFLREDIGIAILDIGMPGMNGIQAAEVMRREKPECCLIFLTAYDKFEYARKAVAVRAMEYLLKPYSNKEIIAVVEEALRTRNVYEELLHERGISREDMRKAFDPGYCEETRAETDTAAAEETGLNRLSVMASMVEEFIRTNYMYELSMHEAAKAVNYSEPYFCTMFKQQFGQNFTSYLTEYRINEAKKLLKQPNVNVKEVGIRVGYPDSNYFTKVFRRMVGTNPSEYRMEMLQQL